MRQFPSYKQKVRQKKKKEEEINKENIPHRLHHILPTKKKEVKTKEWCDDEADDWVSTVIPYVMQNVLLR